MSDAVNVVENNKLLSCAALLLAAGTLFATKGRVASLLGRSEQVAETGAPALRSSGLEAVAFRFNPELEARVSALELTGTRVRAAFDDWWHSFCRIRQMKLTPTNSPLIAEGDLIHGMRGYDEQRIASIFKSGVVSGELELPGKAAVFEDGETFGCADFFVNRGRARSVKDYIQFARERNLSSPLRTAPMEHAFMPAPVLSPFKAVVDRRVALVLDASNAELGPLLQQSATSETVAAKPILSRLIHAFPRQSDRHLAVLGGLPANSINKVIVGLRVSEPEIASIYKMADEAGLNLSVFRADGALMPVP